MLIAEVFNSIVKNARRAQHDEMGGLYWKTGFSDIYILARKYQPYQCLGSLVIEGVPFLGQSSQVTTREGKYCRDCSVKEISQRLLRGTKLGAAWPIFRPYSRGSGTKSSMLRGCSGGARVQLYWIIASLGCLLIAHVTPLYNSILNPEKA
jgi:hypothetical protein